MKTLKKISITILLLVSILLNKLSAQGGIGINATGTSPDANSILDVGSTTKGILTPRMSLAERNSIVAPAAGLLIYQVSGTPASPQGYYYHNGTKWNKVEEQLVGIVQQPATILAGDGFTVSTISTGKNLIDYTGSAFTNSPTVLLSAEYTEVGTSPVIGNYCQPSFTSCNSTPVFTYISGVTLYSPVNLNAPDLKLNISLPSGCNLVAPIGYSNKTATAPLGCMNVGAQAYLRVTRESAGTLDWVTAWIDYNQDGFFTPSEIESNFAPNSLTPFSGSNPGNGLIIFNFSVGNPNAFNGNTFMRIMTRSSSSHSNPCIITGGTDNGETEDFTVCITGGLPAAYANDHNYCNISNITNTQTTVNCYNRFGSITNSKYHFKIISND